MLLTFVFYVFLLFCMMTSLISMKNDPVCVDMKKKVCLIFYVN